MKLLNVYSTAWISLIVDKHTVLVALVPYGLRFLWMNLLACSEEDDVSKLSVFCIIHNYNCLRVFLQWSLMRQKKKQITFKVMS